MKAAPFFAADPALWEVLVESLPKPWRREHVLLDLRYHENEHRRGIEFPARRVLAERWGWTDKRARGILEDAAWHDPTNPVSMAELVGHRTPQRASEGPKVGPAEGQADNGTTPTINTERASEGPKVGPAEGLAGATRGRSPRAHQPGNQTTINHPDTPVVPKSDPAFVPGPGSDPEVVRVWFQARQWCPIAEDAGKPVLGERPPLPAAQAIRARIHEAGVDAVLEVVEWVYRGPDPWWREHNPSPASFMRPSHFATLAPKARAWVASGRPRAGPAPSAAARREAQIMTELQQLQAMKGDNDGNEKRDHHGDPTAQGQLRAILAIG